MFTDPLAGWREVAVRQTKTKLDWAVEMTACPTVAMHTGKRSFLSATTRTPTRKAPSTKHWSRNEPAIWSAGSSSAKPQARQLAQQRGKLTPARSGQLDLNRVRARPPALQFPHRLLRTGSLFVRIGPTHRSIEHTIARVGRCDRRAQRLCSLRVGRFAYLVEYKIPAWPESECRLCQAAVQINSSFTHGLEYLALKAGKQ